MGERSVSRRPAPRLVVRVALAPALALLAACGSGQAVTPTPEPTPVTTRAFVHVASRAAAVGSSAVDTHEVRTLVVDPGTGLLTAVPAPPLRFSPLDWHHAIRLAADSTGRFVFVALPRLRQADATAGPLLVRSYRVDAGTGGLALAGEVPNPRDTSTYRLSVTATRLYLGGIQPATSDRIFTVRSAVADSGGGLAMTNLAIHAYDDTDRYPVLVAADPGNELFYMVRGWSRELAVARYDSSRQEVRELAALRIGDPMEEPYLYVADAACVAADGLLFVADGSVRSFALTESPATLVQRAAVTGGGDKEVAHVRGLLATATVREWISTTSVSTGINLYQVGAGGELSLRSSLARGTFADVAAMAFHPSGRFLYVAAVRAEKAPDLELLTYSVEPDGSLRLFAALQFASDGKTTIDQMVVTVPAS
jgi:hypothetical protein